MTSPSDCVVIIPAKGMSRRLPRKNLSLCAGVSLVERAVRCAAQTKIFEAIVVSSEDQEVLDAVSAIRGGRELVRVFPAHRPSILSADGVSVAAVVSYLLAINNYRWEHFCVLWPTSPLRTPEMLRAMWRQYDGQRFKCLHSVYARDPTQLGGTAIFMATSIFLRRLSLDYKGDQVFPVEDALDVNTPEDLAEAERRLLAREAQCQSS